MIATFALLALGQPTPAKPLADRLLIVAPERFRAPLAPYVAHKRRQLAVEFASLEMALASTRTGDAPERLKRFVFAGWKERRVRYLLLAGDADTIPVRYMVLDRITPAAFDYAFYPTDLYYGDLAKADGSFENWNGRQDGFHKAYFGEVRGEKNKADPINFDAVDYRPEIGVGRWPASTEKEVAAIVAKTIAYEERVLTGEAQGIRRAAMIGVDGWVDCRAFMDGLAAALPAGWAAEKRYGPEAASPTPKPTAAEVVSLLNGGLSLILHTGHGSDNGWHLSFGSGNLGKLTNGDGLPVMFSAGCSTGRFATLPPYEPYVDIHGMEHAGTNAGEVFKAPPPAPNPYATGKYNLTGLGEKIVRLPNAGAVAYIGCNTGSQPAALTLMDEFVKALQNDPRPRLGNLWKTAVARFYAREKLATLKPTESWYPASIFFQAMKFMVYGDPSLVMPGPATASGQR